jgi:hypothetical protein
MSSIDNPSSETPTAENPFAPPTVEPLVPDDERMQTWTGDLTKTGTGLTLVLFGTLSVLVSAGVLAIGVTVVVVAFESGWVLLEWAGGGVAILGLVGVLIGGLMLFVGPFRCLSAAAAVRGRGLIIGSVVCQTLVGVMVLGMGMAPSIIAMYTSLTSHVLFVVFMRRIAEFIGRLDLAARAGNILIGGSIMASCIGILGIARLVATQSGGFFTTLTGTVLALATAVSFVMYVGLLNALRRAIKSGAAP